MSYIELRQMSRRHWINFVFTFIMEHESKRKKDVIVILMKTKTILLNVLRKKILSKNKNTSKILNSVTKDNIKQ